MDIEDFEIWGLIEKDFKIDYYLTIYEGVVKDTVKVEIIPFGISVSCHSKINDNENKKQCFNMLYTIFDNAVVL